MPNVSVIIENFKKEIINLLNNSELPPAVKYYVLKDVFIQMENEYQTYINTCLKQDPSEDNAQEK